MTHDSRWFWLTVASITFFLLYLLSPILTPFVLGALLAYLGDPLADKLETRKLSRTVSVSIVFSTIILLMLIIFLLIIPLFETQLSRLFVKLPAYIDWTITLLQPQMRDIFGIDTSVLEVENIKKAVTQHWGQTGGFIKSIIQTLSHSSMVLLGWLTTIMLTPVITFYLLRDWDKLVAYIQNLLPRNIEPLISQLAKESDEVLGAFLRGQLTVMLALGTIYSIGLGLIGVEFALLIGMVAGIVSFVPYLGLIVGVLIAGTAIMFQTYDVIDLMLVFLVFGVAQVIEAIILTPLFVGERIGLHPVTVIFAVLAGGQLFGFFGVLLALPIAAILAVLMRHLHNSYKESNIYAIKTDDDATTDT